MNPPKRPYFQLEQAELDFSLDETTSLQIIDGVDFVQLKSGPFDLDLVFAPDGIASFDEARERMISVDGFPVAHIRDIIASKRASSREKDLADLPPLEEFREELEKRMHARRAEEFNRDRNGQNKRIRQG